MFEFVQNAFKSLQALGYRRGETTDPPIFIVGCGHSGTSLLLNILGKHSRIYAIPQETYLAYNVATHTAQLAPDAKAKLRRFDKVAISHGKKRWVEKTPSHIHAIAELIEICPACKILIIVRDGRDVACSIQDRTGDLAEGIRRWVDDNKAGQKFWKHLNVRVLKYESLIEEFESTLTSTLSFVGETFEEQMRHYHKTPQFFYSNKIEKPTDAFGENHAKYRNWQINQPLFDGRGKWKRLSAAEKNLINGIAGDMLIEYGYVEGTDW